MTAKTKTEGAGGGLSLIHVIKGRRFLLEVESSANAEDYRKYEDLRSDIWGFPEDSLPGTRNMLCENFLHEGSSLYLAAYAADEKGNLERSPESCVGFSYGFVGLKDKSLGFDRPENLWFYAQYTGVRESFRSYGLGVLLKELQRDVLLRRFGVATVVCTYDPLTGVNARRNIHHFGMDVLEYRPAVYGEFGGYLNRSDIPSDRFFMSWDLKRKLERPNLSPGSWRPLFGATLGFSVETVKGKSGPVKLEVVRDAAPVAAPRGEFVLVPIPSDFYSMLRETDVDDPAVRRIPLDWRLATRKAFQSLLAEGYRIIDFTTVAGLGQYVLSRRG